MVKNFFGMILSGALVLTVPLAPARANEDAAKAIAGIIAIGLLGAAIGKHQAKEGHDNYTPHPRVHADENAVGACMHNGELIVRRAGGYSFELEDIRDIHVKGDITVVTFHGTGYYTYGHKTSLVQCQVRNHRVISFNYT
jgi:hypothetical protein